jgi:GTP cyclohydrolase I
MTVDVAPTVRGTHMSRFIEALHQSDSPMNIERLAWLAKRIRALLESQRATVRMTFPYFLTREAPASGLRAPMDYEGRLAVSLGASIELTVGVRTPVTSLCPCSKEISDFGAHNQRGYVEIDVVCAEGAPVWIEDLVEIAEEAASAPVYSLLKRVDEREVTMQAYEKPAFVEDIARDAAVALREDERVESYIVRVTNLESIHSHNAIATVRGRRG